MCDIDWNTIYRCFTFYGKISTSTSPSLNVRVTYGVRFKVRIWFRVMVRVYSVKFSLDIMDQHSAISFTVRFSSCF